MTAEAIGAISGDEPATKPNLRQDTITDFRPGFCNSRHIMWDHPPFTTPTRDFRV